MGGQGRREGESIPGRENKIYKGPKSFKKAKGRLLLVHSTNID